MKLLIFYNPHKKAYYHKFIKSYCKEYCVGYKNQYNHEIIYLIDNVYTEQIVLKKNLSIRYLVLTPMISLLKKLTEFLQKINK